VFYEVIHIGGAQTDLCRFSAQNPHWKTEQPNHDAVSFCSVPDDGISRT
jgi:hypothetical protein